MTEEHGSPTGFAPGPEVASAIGQLVYNTEELNQYMRLALVYCIRLEGFHNNKTHVIEVLLNMLSVDQMRIAFTTIVCGFLENEFGGRLNPLSKLDSKVRTAVNVRNVVAHSTWARQKMQEGREELVFQRAGRAARDIGQMEIRIITFEAIEESIQFVDTTKQVIVEICRFLRDASVRSAEHKSEFELLVSPYSDWLNTKHRLKILEFTAGRMIPFII